MNEHKHPSQILTPAIADLLEPLTKAALPITQELEKSYLFQTFNDPQLEAMLQAAERFRLDMEAGARPRWITFLGNSGAGKTYLADKLKTKAPSELNYHSSLLKGTCRWEWVKLLSKLREEEYWRLNDIADANLAMIDDIGTEAGTKFSSEKLFELLARRTRKWTIITANMSLEQVAQKIDPRVASRMIRDGSEVVDVACQDFSMRTRKS